jgi:predicted nucleotidyltransferase
MKHRQALPDDVGERIATLGSALEACPTVEFAYLFGGAAIGRITPLSDIDIAVYLRANSDFVEGRLDVHAQVARHLGTDELDIVVLNTAPSSLLARVLPGRRILLDHAPFLRHRFESNEARKAADFLMFERRLLERRFDIG